MAIWKNMLQFLGFLGFTFQAIMHYLGFQCGNMEFHLELQYVGIYVMFKEVYFQVYNGNIGVHD